MRTFPMFISLFFATFSLCSLAQGINKPVNDLVAEQQTIRQEIHAGTGRFADMPLVKRDAILSQQDKLFELVDGKSDLDDLNPQQMTDAINIIASISAAIENKEDERIVCERTRATGSKLVTRVCKSVAQIKAEKAAAQAQLRTGQ